MQKRHPIRQIGFKYKGGESGQHTEIRIRYNERN